MCRQDAPRYNLIHDGLDFRCQRVESFSLGTKLPYFVRSSLSCDEIDLLFLQYVVEEYLNALFSKGGRVVVDSSEDNRRKILFTFSCLLLM